MNRFSRKSVHIEKGFSRVAGELRKTFEKKFEDPRKTAGDRFVWDYWHIENQYSVLRTPARYYFPKAQFEKLEAELNRFGQRELGCNGISDPWLSLYTDGSYQNLHADSPHGPWAYVFSLTPWRGRKFRGGETLVARDRLLEFWPNFVGDRRNERGIEFEDLFQSIPAEFNQLTLFDPRLPHGVKEVRGSREPLEGRLVVHGWFVEPRPFVEGALAGRRGFASAIDALLEPIARALSPFDSIQGTASVRASVNAKGSIGKQVLLRHTLLDAHTPADPRVVREALRAIAEGLADGRLPEAKGSSQITIPFLFR